MTLKLYTVKIECMNEEDNEPAFIIEAFDEYTAEVKIENSIYTLDSWRELSKAVEEAFKLLELKE